MTVIKTRGILEVANTRSPIPRNDDLTVNYQEYVDRVYKVYAKRIDKKLKNNLTKGL